MSYEVEGVTPNEKHVVTVYSDSGKDYEYYRHKVSKAKRNGHWVTSMEDQLIAADRIIIKFSKEEKSSILAASKILDAISYQSHAFGLYEIQIDYKNPDSVDDAIAILRKSELPIEFISYHEFVKGIFSYPTSSPPSYNPQSQSPSVVPGGQTYFNNQWALLASSSYGIKAEKAWDIKKDASIGQALVRVAVIDTGVNYNSPEFNNSGIWLGGYNFIANNSDPNDNGEPHFNPGQYQMASLTAPYNGMLAGPGHGTHVAGIIGASGYDNQGVTGVAWKVGILGYKVFGWTLSIDSGDFDQDGNVNEFIYFYITSPTLVSNAVSRAIQDNADIINLSLGGAKTDASYNIYNNAFVNARNAGIIVVCAAGNNNGAAANYVPGGINLDNVITVAATKSNGTLAEFSNTGNTVVDIAAPGTGIVSVTTMAFRQATFTYNGNSYNNWTGTLYGYLNMNGTSQAAPLVSGTLALLMAAYPNEVSGTTYLPLINRLKNGSVFDTNLAAHVDQGRRLNLYKSLNPWVKTNEIDDDYFDTGWFGSNIGIDSKKITLFHHEFIFSWTFGWVTSHGLTFNDTWHYFYALPDFKWIWTSPEVFPYIYRHNNNRWYWYDVNTCNPTIIYDLTNYQTHSITF